MAEVCYNDAVTPVISIVLVMGLCYEAWGSFYFFFLRRGKDFGRNWISLFVYFACVGAILTAIFWQNIAPLVRDFSIVPCVVLAIFMLVQLLVHVRVPEALIEPHEYFERHPMRQYLRLGWRRLVSKSADIAAQQVFIVLLVVFLKEEGLPLTRIVLGFTLLFGFLHMPLIASERGRWPSWLFLGAVVLFGVTFPPLILFVPYGFVYTFMLHWMFYTGSALVFWLWHNKFENRRRRVMAAYK